MKVLDSVMVITSILRDIKYTPRKCLDFYSFMVFICFVKSPLDILLYYTLLLLLLSRLSHVRLCATPQMAAHQAPPSLGFSRQEHWSGLPFPSPMHYSEK